MQASIVNYCKEVKAVKIQKQTIPVTEEEEERSHDNDEESKQVLYCLKSERVTSHNCMEYIRWWESEHDYLSFTQKIPIPPPERLMY
jgi:hypothetical protein